MRGLRGVFLACSCVALVFASACMQPHEPETRDVSADDVSVDISGSVEPTATSPQAELSSGTFKLSMDATAHVENGRFLLSATTDLMDGSVVVWEVGRAAPEDQWLVDRSGEAVVKDGRFSIDVDVADVSDETLYAYLVFTTYGQPQAVRAVYGEIGEHIDGGEHEVMRGDYRRLEYWVKAKR